MNYKKAPGRNWAAPSRRRRSASLPESCKEARPRASSLLMGHGLEHHSEAPGRNWVRETHRKHAVHLRPADERSAWLESYPLRERGGGDHDEPYEP
jgi:hypothetical protein